MRTQPEDGQTYELTISFYDANTKRAVLAWLAEQGIVEVVEGVIDGVDLIAPDDVEATAEAMLSDLDASPVAIYDAADRLSQLSEQIVSRFGRRLETRLVAISTTAWQQAWDSEPHFVGFETERFVVASDGSRPAAMPGKLGLQIQRGVAFGDGRHATTQVALELLEAVASPCGGSVLDVGTGSGILAIAAARLGMSPILATEIDGAALDEARANAAANGVEGSIDWLLTERVPVSDRYDLVCANILVPVLHALMPDFSTALRPGGRLVLAGFIEKDEAQLLDRAAAVGLGLVQRASVRGWSGLVLAHV